jgi:hypothetical protein
MALNELRLWRDQPPMRTFLAAAALATLNMQSNAASLVALALLLLTTRGITIFLMHPPTRRLRQRH